MNNQSWYSIRAAADKVTEVFIFDEIGFFGVSAKDFIDDLKANHKKGNTLKVSISSPGGSVVDGLAIGQMITENSPSIASVKGMAASIAAFIAIKADTMEMAENSLLMIHNPEGVTIGGSDDHRKMADFIDKNRDMIASAFVSKTGKSLQEIQDFMDAETWFTASEAVDAGFADSIIEPVKMAANAGALAMHDFRNFAPLGREDVTGRAARKANVMADDVTKAAGSDAPKAATLKELQAACDGGGNDFLIAQIEAEATVEQASKQWMKALVSERDTAKTEAVEAKTEVDTLKAEAEEKPKAPEPNGVAPLGNSGSGGESGESGDPIANWYDAIAAEMKQGKTEPKAIHAVVTGNPELHAAYLEAYNTQHASGRSGAKAARK